MKPTLKAPETKRLKLKYDELPSNFAFKFNLRRYSTVVRRKRSGELLGDLTKHGQTLLLAAGGEGGMAARRSQKMQAKGRRGVGAERALGENVEVSDIDLDDATFTATGGEPGEAGWLLRTSTRPTLNLPPPPRVYMSIHPEA